MTKFMQKLTTGILSLLMLTTFSTGIVFSINNSVAKAEGAMVINPIAKYEFKDASNLGKDSMGNYNMEYRRTWVSNGEGTLLDTYTNVDEVNGGVTFDESFCISQGKDNDMFADVTAFTLCFEVKTMGTATEKWQHILGVGDTNDEYGLYFNGRAIKSVSTRPGQLRLIANKVTKTGVNAPKIYDGTDEPTDYLKVVISAQPGGELVAYLNGTKVTLTNSTVNLSEDWKVYPETEPTTGNRFYFSIGSSCYQDVKGGNYVAMSSKTAKASVRNVQFYDFAMDANCVAAYNASADGQITTDDVKNLKTITSFNQVDFGGDATSEVLNTEMTSEEMLAKVNEANAVLNLSNGETVSTPITWNAVEQVEDKYYVKGSFETSKLGYANVYGKEVSYELPVVKLTALGGEFKGASISTAGDIGLNFYVAMRDGIESVTATMQMVGCDAIEVEGVYNQNRSAWVFTYPVVAKDFDKQVALTVTEVNGASVEGGATATASVENYINYIKEDTTGTYGNVKQLVADLETYCMAAQDYFEGNEVGKVTENVIASSNLGDKVGTVKGEDANITIIGATLILETKTKINVYFTANSEVTCLVNDESATAKKVVGTENLYVLSIEVVAKDLGVMQEFTIGGYTVSYSALSYVEASVDTADAALYNVLQALYDYSLAANEYFA